MLLLCGAMGHATQRKTSTLHECLGAGHFLDPSSPDTANCWQAPLGRSSVALISVIICFHHVQPTSDWFSFLGIKQFLKVVITLSMEHIFKHLAG